MRKRMTKLLGFILAVLAAAAFISCEEEIPFNGKYSGEKLVLFSTVNPDSGRIAVSVSSSRFFLRSRSIQISAPTATSSTE